MKIREIFETLLAGRLDDIQMEDEPRAGRPSTSETYDNVERVRSLLRSDRRLTLRMISSELSLNWFTVLQILTRNLGMRKRPMSHGSFHQ
jgi:hypothetical protein